MAETQIGTFGVAWGLATGATGTGVGTMSVQSANLSVEADELEIRNGTGTVTSKVFFNKRQTVTLEVIPTGSTIALAKAANILPANGAAVTISDADDSEIVGAHSGVYIFNRGTKSKTVDGAVRLTFELVQYTDVNVSTAIAAA